MPLAGAHWLVSPLLHGVFSLLLQIGQTSQPRDTLRLCFFRHSLHSLMASPLLPFGHASEPLSRPPFPGRAVEEEGEGELFVDEDEVLAGAAQAGIVLNDVDEVRGAALTCLVLLPY